MSVRLACRMFTVASLVAALAIVAMPAGPVAAASLPAGTKQLNAITCATATACVAVGSGSAVVSTDGGTTWTSSPIPAGTWWAVSCSSATACVAGGTDTGGNNALIVGTTDGGATWSQLFSTPGGQFNGVSCKGATCVAVGTAFINNAQVALTAGTSGGSWAALTPPAGATQLNSVVCVDAAHCWAGGFGATSGLIAASTDAGHSWTVQTLASDQNTQGDTVQGLSFPDAMHGFLTLGSGGCGGPGVIGCGGGIESTSDGGAHWALVESIGNGPTEYRISCPDALNCEVVGGQRSGGVVQVTSDGGAHWSEQGGPVAGQTYLGVACMSDTSCLVVGSTGNGGTGTVASNAGTGGAPPPPPACTPGPLSPAPTGIVTRQSGADRDATAVAVSQATFAAAGSAKAVVLAYDANYPDALAGSPLAVAKHAPLLLTPAAGLPAAVSAEIGRVAPKGSTVYILGGTTALSPAIDAAVVSLGDTPQRVAGADRFATAVAIAGVLGDPHQVLLATGVAFPDALSAGAAAAKVSGAVLLTNGTQQATETGAYLVAHSGDTVTAVGGPAASADPGAASVVGADRYATAADVAQKFFTAPTLLGFASGVTFPDALSGSAAIGAGGGPMLLVPACGTLPSALSTYLASVKAGATGGTLYGGPFAVGDDVLTSLESAA